MLNYSVAELRLITLCYFDSSVGEKNKKQATRLIDKSPVLKYNNV